MISRPETSLTSRLAALVFLAAGCTTTIIPPAQPDQPISVYLLDHGRTPSLVLPSADGGMTRYAYGDWNWYALRNTGPVAGARALFLPTQGALGRQELSGPPVEASLPQGLGSDAWVNLHPITVGLSDVEQLRARLDREHSEGAKVALVESFNMEFVPHPLRYTWFRNSNHVVAAWLRELGCETEGLAFHSRWKVKPKATR